MPLETGLLSASDSCPAESPCEEVRFNSTLSPARTKDRRDGFLNEGHKEKLKLLGQNRSKDYQVFTEDGVPLGAFL